jgi:hypothetical protein|tara:strand:+ start:4065 stop:4883 length:819 start_codon:yes stop_codon:yes gene_type:complete
MSEVKTNKISSLASNNDITLDPDGTGRVAVTGSATMTGTDTFNSNATGSGILLKDSGVTSRQLHMAAPGSVSEAVIGTPNSHNLTFATNNTERMRIESSSGAVLIGKTSLTSNDPGLELNTGADANVARVDQHKTASGDFAGHYFFHNGSNVGGIDYSNSAVNYGTSSDYRLKENVADMTGAITRVKALSPKRFNFIIDPDRTVDGFLAHEAQTVVPEAISGTKDKVDEDGKAVMQGIDQSKLVPLLTGALQEAIAKIEALETKVAALEAGE